MQKIEGEFRVFVEDRFNPLETHVIRLSNDFEKFSDEHRRRATDLESEIRIIKPIVNEINTGIVWLIRFAKLSAWFIGLIAIVFSIAASGHALGLW